MNKIYADGKFVGVAVFEENCDVPTSFITSSCENLSTSSSDRKETSDLNKTSSELLCTKYSYGTKRPFACPKCSYKAKRKHHLKNHLLRHSSEIDSKVMVNNQIQIDDDGLEKKPNFNEYSSSSDQEGMRNRFNCLECDFTTKHKYSFTRHVDKMHLNRLHCTDCDFTTSNKRSLESHLQRHRQNYLPFEVVNNKGPVEMYFGEGNKNDNNIDATNSSGTDSTNELNSDCKHKSGNKGTLDHHLRGEDDTHMLTHTANEEANYVKEDSGSEDELEINIGDSIRKQPKSRWYKCTQCSFKANNSRFLDSHVRTHNSKITVHECSVCSYRTKSRQNFKVHMFKHTNTIPNL